jgi:hypothetical protein
MASQAGISRLQIRLDGAEMEDEVRGRMVSAEYFDTLGVPALIGHGFWQRRLGGRAQAVGATFILRQTIFTVIGVMPMSFFGETVGDRPDVWLPLAMQPEVLPGRDAATGCTAIRPVYRRPCGCAFSDG